MSFESDASSVQLVQSVCVGAKKFAPTVQDVCAREEREG